MTDRPTLHDVAAMAAVSTATVSRCLNAADTVRPELRERVRGAIAELGYTPHGAARALASQRARTIGAVIPTLDNAIFAAGIQAMQNRLSDVGYTLLLASSNYDPEQERNQVQSLIERGLDGLMLIGEARPPGLYDLLEQKAIPHVNTWTYRPGSRHPSIGFDNRGAAHRVASYLIDMGHSDIAMIAGITAGNDRAAERLSGVRAALADRGLAFAPGRVIESPYSIGDGRRALRRLMAAESRPTAIVCGNDVLAYGALFECHALGVPVPGQVSIAGFDDLELAAELVPALTTMHVPSDDMGRLAAEYLLDRIDGRPTPGATKLGVDLIIRGSTGPPPGRPRPW
ncbi:MAG: LacI family DNA-binding transcriptional regulator [Inquilinus sp.]|nr:LacI family DNA-binding transcriptional regulator [Inquilinus sp.]